MEIEGFGEIIGTLALAKKLHDAGRSDIAEKYFADELWWDCHYENISATISNLFPRFESRFNEERETEEMIFGGGPIAGYFRRAQRHGRKRGQAHSKNASVQEAKEKIAGQFNFSYCLDWKLSGKIGSKKTKNASKLTIRVNTSCGCNALEGAAFGIVEMYKWLSEKCNEFKKQKQSRKKTRSKMPRKRRRKTSEGGRRHGMR